MSFSIINNTWHLLVDHDDEGTVSLPTVLSELNSAVGILVDYISNKYFKNSVLSSNEFLQELILVQ